MVKRKKMEAPKQPETYEEFLEGAWEGFNSTIGHHVPPMNYPFKIGESVYYGNLADCRIEEIFENGNIHISYHDRGQTYGRPFDNKRRIPRIVWWVDIFPIDCIEETRFSKERIRSQNTNTTLDSLVHTAYWRGLIDNPIYQRGYVWTLEDKQRLIQTIMDRNDIGKFLTVVHPYPENRVEIVDGKQRLRAIMDYMEGRFEFKGKTYFQLSGLDKYAFHDCMISVTELDTEYCKTSDILYLFLSVNAGGVPQTEEHIAHVRKLYEEALEKEKP